MNAATRAGAFAVGVTAAFALAFALGGWIGPVGGQAVAQGHDEHLSQAEHDHGTTDEHGSTETATAAVPGGLMVSDGGYTFDLPVSTLPAGPSRPVAFTIDGPDGPVTKFDDQHEKALHLIAVRRDFAGFQHVHPVLAADGTWSTELDLTPGQWRLFADFKPSGADPLTLGADLAVPGTITPADPTRVSRSTSVDGYDVTLSGDLVPGEHSVLDLEVTRDGRPVRDLEPYLGAYGHLVALRSGDLAYLHVHPDGAPGDGTTAPGPDVVFGAEVPSAGSYHLYFDFQHDGVVRTARFLLDAPGR